MKTKSKKALSKIGIGTWTINKNNLKDEVEALKFYFENGINYIDVVLAYDNGAVIDVIAEFLKSITREDIFINAFITHGCKTIEDIDNQINFYLDKLQTDYLDCVTLHSPVCLGFSFTEYEKEITRLYDDKRFLNIGYSNLSPEQLELVKSHTAFF